MGVSSTDGPFIVYGKMGGVSATQFGTYPEPDPNTDAGPGINYQGDSVPDVRFFFQKDRVQGNAGMVPTSTNLSYLQSVDQIPATASATLIAAAQNATNGTPFTLASTTATGRTLNIPIVPWIAAAGANNILNSAAPVIVPIMLDYGFAFGNCTSGSATVVVADSTQFVVGMPLVIAHVGTASTNQALLTNVVSITDATHIVVGPNLPQATINPTPIGTGNLWGIKEGVGYPVPSAHFPYQAAGPGFFLDPAQTIARNVSILGVTSGTGGNIDVTGYDIYWQPMTERIAATAGATTTAGKKAFKAIVSVTPRFTDAHNYSVGTGDVFGMHFRSDRWEYSNIFWAGAFASSSTGWTAADLTSPSTNVTGDVRGTVATASLATIGSASNGTVSSLAMTGRRLAIFQSIPLYNMISATPAAPQTMFGQLQSPT
jgi:hypothetical protein